MTQILAGIWQNTPIWVWPLFCVLVGIGILAMRDRSSTIIPYCFYPLFGLTAANAIINMAHAPTAWIIFGAAYIIGMGVAFWWQNGLILQKTGIHMQLKGDRITIVILMVIFFSNFVNGVVGGISPTVQASTGFTYIFATVIGLCSGSFTGRALRVITLGNRA